jgi:Tol biopolymer transport system component/DNA-binding winged helix-turn-helix (wHTH) protein
MAAETHLIYEFDEFHLEPDRRKLWRRGEVIPLHGKAFELLLALIRNRGKLLTKNEILGLVWPDQIVEESNLTVNISAIRRALGEHANNPRYITTVSGRGYQFTGEVRQFPEEALTIERESFARMVVEQEETESRTTFGVSARQIEHAIRRFAARPSLLFTMCAVVLAIAGVGFWMGAPWSLLRTASAPLPWTNMTLHRFATQGGVPFRVAISPDGKSIVYRQRTNGKESLWLGRIDSNSSVLISQQTNDLWYDVPVFSPDGGSIYVNVRESERARSKLVRMSVLGGVMTEVSSNVSSPVTFSPNGQHFAFLRHDGETKQTSIIIAAAPDGKNERTLITRKSPENFSSLGLSWSPDGRTIAVGAKTADHKQTEIVTVGIADANVNRVSNRAWGAVGNMAWMPDGSGLLVATRESVVARRAQIWFVPYPKGEARKITNDLDVYTTETLSLSANGRLAILKGHLTSEVRVGPDGDAQRARTVFRGVEPGYEGVDGLAWTPEGSLLYSAYVGDSQAIWEVNVNGSNPRRLTTTESDSVDREMRVTSSGQYIVFQSNRSGSFQIWRANRDGSNLKQLTNGDNNAWPSLSLDGKWIVYSSDRESGETLWRISIDGGEPVQLTTKASFRPQVSPDGKYIACFEPSESSRFRLVIITFNGGEVVKTFTVPDTFILTRAVWTPDGAALIYRDGIQGLWRQRLDQERPEQVKDFEDKEVYQLAWSFDGKSLAYSTGARMQEIILLENSN